MTVVNGIVLVTRLVMLDTCRILCWNLTRQSR